MRRYTIQVDEIIMNQLKRHAEPFVDTPNSVLHKLLFGTRAGTSSKASSFLGSTRPELDLLSNVPKALSQVLEVVYEVRSNGLSRTKATTIVADRRGKMPQTIIDKYCRQLNQKASDMDRLLKQHDLSELRLLLKERFPYHIEVIESFFDLILGSASTGEPTFKVEDLGFQGEAKRTHTRQELGRLTRKTLARYLRNDWGHLASSGLWLTSQDGRKILCLYASLSGDRWWYGVTRTYWESWDNLCHLVFLMRDGKSCSFVLLNPKDSAELLLRIQPAQDGQKKINVRIPAEGKTYLQEWPSFPFSSRVVDLGGINS